MPSILDAIICIVLGILAVPNLIIAKRPDAKQLIDKIAPFQGWIGAIACFWGLWRIIWCVLNIGGVIKLLTGSGGIMGILGMASFLLYAVLSFSLGLLLGIGTLKTFIKNPQAQAKMDQLLAKIAPYQGTLGLLALIDGVALLILMIIG